MLVQNSAHLLGLSYAALVLNFMTQIKPLKKNNDLK
jgi:hypothetical protein